MLTVGTKSYYSKTKVSEGKYIKTSVEETISNILDVEQIQARVHVTHTGPYGDIKWILDGEIFTSRGIPRGESSLPGGTVGLNLSNTRAVDMSLITFDRPDIDELHNKYFIPVSDGHSTGWIELPPVEQDELIP